MKKFFGSFLGIITLIVGFLFLVGLFVLAGIGVYNLLRQPAQQVEVEVEDSLRIPGEGSQKDYSELTGRFTLVKVHDNEEPNENGFYDRTLVSSDPNEMELDEFSLPDGWTIERDFSLKSNSLVGYHTYKPPVGVTPEEIQEWETKIEDREFFAKREITSVIIVDGQECSVRGIDSHRVRINIYVGENWAFQVCPTTSPK